VKLFADTINITPDDTGLPNVKADPSTLQVGLQLLFGVLGAVAIIYIILSALKLVVSQGDPQSVAKTRQSIIYAAVGLVIVISAELIVTFVLGRI
jgi:hypothetical protein